MTALTLDRDSDDKLFQRLKGWFRLASEADKDQRERERDDLRFQVPELQWDESAKRQRLGDAAPGVPAPPRPILSISKLDQPIRLVENQMRNAHLGVQTHPLTPNSDDETAEVIQGLYRAVERNSNANVARLWAYGRAIRCGRGYYFVDVDFESYGEYDDNAPAEAFDLEPKIRRILFQSSVFFDPAAQEADNSDARFVFMGRWVPHDDFVKEFPDAEPSQMDEFRPDDLEPEWVKSDEEGRPALWVARVWWKETEFRTLKYRGRERKLETCKVMTAQICGTELLEKPQPWNGHYLPVITVPGRELQPFDSKRRWDGMIGPNKDGQRTYNYAASTAVELVALEPKAPFIGTPKQFQGYEPEWQQANIRMFPFLRYNQDGEAPPPARQQIDAGRLGPSMMLLQQANDFLQAGTAMFDPSLGRQNGNEKSGKAIANLQGQGTEATSDLPANYVDIALKYEAKVILDMFPFLYDRKDRVVRVLDEQEKSRTVMLNTPYMERDGQLIPYTGKVDGKLPPGVKYFDLSKGRYAIAVSIGRSRQSVMDQVAEELGQILTSRPEMMALIGPEYFRHRDFAGAQEIADMLLKLRDAQYPILANDNDDEGDPRQQVGALKAQLQELQQAAQQMKQALDTKQVEQQAKIATAQIDSQTKLAAADIKAASDERIARMEAMLELLVKQKQAANDDIQADKQVTRDLAVAAGEAVMFPKSSPMSTGKPLAAPKGEV